MTTSAAFQAILCICQFAMCGVSRPDQWQGAQALYVIGSLGKCLPLLPLSFAYFWRTPAANVVTSFYAATFPSLVRDLPKLIQSEHDVKLGAKT